MTNLSIGILAGGKSTRMGENKALLEIEGKRFIDRISQELGEFSEVLLSAAHPGDYADLGLPVVVDKHADIGPIEGIYQVLLHAKEEYVFICGADMPFITRELVEYMAEFISSDYDCYCMVDENHIHPLCAIYSRKMLDVIRAQIEGGQYRLLHVLNAVRTKYIRLGSTCFDMRVIRNVNTREEYVRLKCPLVFCVSGIKDSGKTGLIIRLINEFIKEHYSVAVIKHDGHEFTMDHEGTDTWRYAQAGAEKSLIFSDTQYALQVKGHAEISELLPLCRGADVIILEGMKHSLYPKVEVVRGACSDRPVCDPRTLICIATDIVSPESVSCPVYDINDSAGIFLCVKRFFGI